MKKSHLLQVHIQFSYECKTVDSYVTLKDSLKIMTEPDDFFF